MDNFTLFPNLAVELRLKIWRSTLPGPRNVGIKLRIKDAGFGGWIARKSTHPPPVALQVCHESREEAQKYYILSFGTTVYPPTVYFNYEIDTLCFGDGIDNPNRFPESIGASDYLLNLWHGKTFTPYDSKAIQAKNIRSITLDVDENIYGRMSFCWEEIRQFDGLEKLLIITWDPEERADELMAYFKTAMTVVAGENPEWVVPKTDVVSASGRAWGSLEPGALGQGVSI
jgi:hypothetical protein